MQHISFQTKIRAGLAIGILSSFLACPSMPAFAKNAENALQLDQQIVSYGDNFTVRYYDATNSAWIGFYQDTGAEEPVLIASEQVDQRAGGEGSLAIDTGAYQLAPGEYEVVYYSSESSQAGRRTLQIVPQSFHPDQPAYLEGMDGSFHYDAAEAGDGSWIGIYPADAVPGETPSLVWGYLPEGSTQIHTADLDGSGLSFAALEPGEYTACLFEEGTEGASQEFSFSVMEPSGIYATYQQAPDAAEKSVEGTLALAGSSSTLDDYYWLYWGNEEGVLDGFLPIGCMDTAETSVFSFHANQAAPVGATRIFFYEGNSRGKTVRSIPFSVSIPERARAGQDPMYASFAVMTDIHLEEKISSQNNRNAKRAMTDVSKLEPAVDFTITLGDVVNHGRASEYEVLAQFVRDFQDVFPEQYYLIGNHDYSLNMSNPKPLKENFLNATGMEDVYYSFENQGYHYIVLGSDGRPDGVKLTTDEAWLSNTQLRWLEGELAAAAAENPEQPIFLFMHQPLQHTGPGTEVATIVQDKELREILSHYPQVVYFSGHTHNSLNDENIVLTNQDNGLNTVHAGSIGSLWREGEGSYRGSEGCIVEVYDGYLRIRGRDYLEGSWMGSAQYILPTK